MPTSSKLLFSDDGISVAQHVNQVLVLTLDRGPNVVNPSLTKSLHQALDCIDQEVAHPKALVITAKGKFFSNGLDLEYMMQDSTASKSSSTTKDQMMDMLNRNGKMIESFWRLLARILVMDCRTVAAINGHAFGAGIFLALTCDFRIMRTNKGYLCWPEVNLGMRLSKGFAELTKAKVTDPQVLREGVLTGKRYSSRDALNAKLIDQECEIDDLLQVAVELARAGFPDQLRLQNFNPENFKVMKMELYTDAYRALAMGSFDAKPESRL